MEHCIIFELKKVELYNLQPYGRFTIKFKTRQGHLPRILPLDEMHLLHSTSMPIDDETDEKIVRFMKKNKTDILTDGEKYYTRFGNGFGEVYHKKLTKYKTDEAFRELVDNDS